MLVQVLNCIALGVLLLVLASGLALIFGLRGVVNFAHGAFYMLAAYLAFSIQDRIGFWAALIIVPLAFGILGVFLDRFGLRYFAHRNILDMLLLTFGLTYVISDVVQSGWGPQPKSVAAPTGLDGVTSVLGTAYPTYRLFLIGVGLASAVALVAWLRLSEIGLHIRAAAENRTVASVLGVDIDRVSALVVGVGTALSGLAGVLAGPYLSLSLTMGADILVLTFIVVVVGGLGSIGGAIGAALLLGAVITFGAQYASGYAAYLPYILMLVVLVAFPRGLAMVRAR